MKFIISFILMAVGFGVCNASVREFFMSQPDWLMIIEGSIVYVVIGFFNAIETTARLKISKYSNGDDGFFGFMSGILWPAHWVVFKPVNWLISNPIDRLLKIADERIDNRVNRLRNKDAS